MTGEHYAVAWVACKGNNYQIYNNTGHGSLPMGAGIRVQQNLDGWGRNNKVDGTKCSSLGKGAYCVYLESAKTGNTVGCTRVVGAGTACNCETKSCRK